MQIYSFDDYTRSLTRPNLSASWAPTMLSQNVVTNLAIFSSDEMIIKLISELSTISKSMSTCHVIVFIYLTLSSTSFWGWALKSSSYLIRSSPSCTSCPSSWWDRWPARWCRSGLCSRPAWHSSTWSTLARTRSISDPTKRATKWPMQLFF